MKFDPQKMCWVNLNAEDEEDPFEGMADDENESMSDDWAGGGGRGGTITRNMGRKLVSIGQAMGSMGSSVTSSGWSSRLVSESSGVFSPRTSQTASVEGGEDTLKMKCKEAEERHRKEMRGWSVREKSGMSEAERERERRDKERREEKRLWEIRVLATRS